MTGIAQGFLNQHFSWPINFETYETVGVPTSSLLSHNILKRPRYPQRKNFIAVDK